MVSQSQAGCLLTLTVKDSLNQKLTVEFVVGVNERKLVNQKTGEGEDFAERFDGKEGRQWCHPQPVGLAGN